MTAARGVRPLRVVHAGVGLWGRSWAEAILPRAPGFRLAGVVEARPSTRSWARSALRVPVFTELAGALGALEPHVVVLATPPSTHLELASAAFDAGCHVLVEKPLAPTLAEAAELVARAERRGRIVMVAQNYRFRRQPRALQQLVASGALGRLEAVQIACRRDFRTYHPAGDFRLRMAHPYTLDMAIHHFDLIRAITGAEVEELTARSWRAPDSQYRGYPSTAALLSLEGGAVAAYEGSWATVLPQTSWNGDWELTGARGRATWTGGVHAPLRGTVRLELRGRPPEPVRLPPLPASDRAALLAELRAAIHEGRQPESSGADNLRSLAVALACARSVDERRPVRPAELLAEG